jgi:hypothetical protein
MSDIAKEVALQHNQACQNNFKNHAVPGGHIWRNFLAFLLSVSYYIRDGHNTIHERGQNFKEGLGKDKQNLSVVSGRRAKFMVAYYFTDET